MKIEFYDGVSYLPRLIMESEYHELMCFLFNDLYSRVYYDRWLELYFKSRAIIIAEQNSNNMNH